MSLIMEGPENVSEDVRGRLLRRLAALNSAPTDEDLWRELAEVLKSLDDPEFTRGSSAGDSPGAEVTSSATGRYISGWKLLMASSICARRDRPGVRTGAIFPSRSTGDPAATLSSGNAASSTGRDKAAP
jgi:hypothetical protein